MTSSRLGKAATAADFSQPSTPPKKRKVTTITESETLPTQYKKSKQAIDDFISSQNTNQSESPADRKASQDHNVTRNGYLNAGRPAMSFAEMYSFTSRTKPSGVVDLTESKSPTSTTYPINGLKQFGSLQGGPKRLVVKNLRTTPKIDPQEFFERKWKDQEAALDSLFKGDDVKILLEELYKATEHICRQGKAAELYAKLKLKCTTHLDGVVKRSLLKIAKSGTTPVKVLQAFVEAWTSWQKQLLTIRHIFFYLNQSYLIRSSENTDINTMGLQMFRTSCFHEAEIQSEVLKGAVQLVQADRESIGANNELLEESINTFHDLGVYIDNFEPDLVQASEEYFKSWRLSEAESSDLSHYVQSCSSLLDREMTRCDVLSLDRSTRSQLSDLFDEIFIAENVARLSNEDAVLDLLEQDKDEDLKSTWTLLSRKAQERLLTVPFGKYIEMEGSAIVFDEKQEDDMVIRLLVFKRKLDHLHVDCFQKNDTMGNTLHKAFESFMNKTKKSQSNWDTDNAKPGEMIAKHVDLLLKGGAKAIPKLAAQTKEVSKPEEEQQEFDDADDNDEASVEQHLADALDLFRFVHGKAVFEAFYKKDLARRLLMGRTQSFDAERSMLTRLRNECGANFTHNLESMFKDMELAREEMKSYNQLLTDRGTNVWVDMTVNVLSVAAWPTYPDIPINIPTSILKVQADFEKHYKDKHVGRKLTWKPSLATCQLRARFQRGAKELVVSGFQAIVLLLFNDLSASASLSYTDIKTLTGLPDIELKRTLQSLACARYRPINKNPKGRDINDTDTFTFNDKFTEPKFRVKINQIQLKETKEENKETHERVAADRHYETQAAIVRIMKASKRIGHNDLIVEVIKATRSRGVLDQTDIKKNIEKLIEKDYMERDDEIRGYSYLA